MNMMLWPKNFHYIWYIKNVLTILNIFFAITGLLIIRTGNSTNDIYLNFSEFLETKLLSPSTLIVTIGFILFIISSISCYGVQTENYNLINVSCIFFALVLIVEVMMAVFGFMVQGQVRTILADSINKTLHQYPMDAAAAHAIDSLQNQLHCCGVKSSQDWVGVLESTDAGNINLPDSCCARFNQEGMCVSVRNHGCLHMLEFLIRRRANLLANLAAFVLFIQTLGLMFSYCLVRLIHQQRADKHRAYNELRESLVNHFHYWQIEPSNEKS